MGIDLILFSIAQGAAIFGTAYLALRLLKTARWFSKVAAISISHVAWVAFTISGYTLLGGEGGLMDGLGLVIFLCLTALISSLVYLLVWMLRPGFRRVANS